MCAMARPGLRCLGQTLEQFMMVWHRYSCSFVGVGFGFLRWFVGWLVCFRKQGGGGGGGGAVGGWKKERDQPKPEPTDGYNPPNSPIPLSPASCSHLPPSFSARTIDLVYSTLIYLEGVIEGLQALLGELVARVLDPPVRLHQHCGGVVLLVLRGGWWWWW
jgi:hypothetical protein